jgi:phage FluMu protein Com
MGRRKYRPVPLLERPKEEIDEILSRGLEVIRDESGKFSKCPRCGCSNSYYSLKKHPWKDDQIIVRRFFRCTKCGVGYTVVGLMKELKGYERKNREKD